VTCQSATFRIGANTGWLGPKDIVAEFALVKNRKTSRLLWLPHIGYGIRALSHFAYHNCSDAMRAPCANASSFSQAILGSQL
jgi:hypothetical protein